MRRGVSKSETARRFGVNRTTVRRSLKRLDALGGSLPEMRPGSRLKLDERTMLLLGEDLEARPIDLPGDQDNTFLTAEKKIGPSKRAG